MEGVFPRLVMEPLGRELPKKVLHVPSGHLPPERHFWPDQQGVFKLPRHRRSLRLLCTQRSSDTGPTSAVGAGSC